MLNERHVIVGAGHAARRAAETLRAMNADVDIVMFGDEPHAPYDRPVLSKDALTSEEGERKAFIRQHDWYAAQRIDLRQALDLVAPEFDAIGVIFVGRVELDHIAANSESPARSGEDHNSKRFATRRGNS